MSYTNSNHCLCSVSIAEHAEELGVKVDKEKLETLLTKALKITEDLPLSPLLELHAQLCRIIYSHSNHLDRTTLPQVSLNLIVIF